MERGENPEDLYYLCSVKDHYYVVFETDYIDTLVDVAREAADIFKGYELMSIHWMVKKDSQPSVGAPIVPIDVGDIDELRKHLVSDKIGSVFGYDMRYAVMEFKSNTLGSKRYDPNTYGMIS
jgi:hypothetical protein